MAETEWINWSALEAKLSEDERISLEQSLTQLAAPEDVEDTPYKNQTVETIQEALERLEASGRVKQADGKMFIDKRLVPENLRHID